MSTPTWQADHDYVEAVMIAPLTPPTIDRHNTLQNADFEDGPSGWDVSGDHCAIQTGQPTHSGQYCLALIGPSKSIGEALNVETIAVEPGTPVSASAWAVYSGSGENNQIAFIFLWLDAEGNMIHRLLSPLQKVGTTYAQYTASAIPPEGAARARIGVHLEIAGSEASNVQADDVSHSTNYELPDFHYLFQAENAGASGSTEPAWPTKFGDTVLDGSITWKCVYQNRYTWQAFPLMISGASEPAWPESDGSTVKDGSILWTAYSKMIMDANCPHSKIVCIAASKVYAYDSDPSNGNIVAYSATNNPLDWSTAGDAGFLPFGMQKFGANPVIAINLYRSNLVIFNAEGFQVWQVDEDPANDALLDALPFGCVSKEAVTPVGNDLVFLSPEGVRSLAMSASRDALSGNTMGSPVDSMVIPLVPDVADAYYDTGRGQYLIAFRDKPETGQTTIFVFTMASKAWSRYVLPFPVDYFCQVEDKLAFRAGDAIMQFDGTAETDAGTEIDAVVQWPWLGLDDAALTKRLTGLDAVASDAFDIALGCNENDPDDFFVLGSVLGDTLPGQVIAVQAMAPSFSIKCTFKGTQWQLRGLRLYFQPNRAMS